MIQRKASISRLLSSASTHRFGKDEKGKEPSVIDSPIRLPRRRTLAVRVTSNEDSTDSDQHLSTSHSSTSTTTLHSARLLRLRSKTGLRSPHNSDPSLPSISRRPSEGDSSRLQPKNSFRSKAPKPLKLDEKATPIHIEQPLSSRETPTTLYEEQFRRRRGDPLHRLGSSVPYMQAYDPTSLQCDTLTTRLLESLCEPGTPCFYKFNNRSAVTTVLDLGCGPQLRWAVSAAHFWPNAKIIGVDCIRPHPDAQIPSNVEFLEQNFLEGLPTIKTESVDFVRMSCLGTSIPKAEWPIVLAEVRRILKTGGAIEIIDDELVRAYPTHPPKEPESLELKERMSRVAAQCCNRADGLHPIDRYFQQMLVKRYGMPETPHRAIDTAMDIVFGENDKKHFRVELPSPGFKIVETEEMPRGGNRFQTFRGRRDSPQPAPFDTPSKAQRVLGLDSVAVGEKVDDPFLILYPNGLCHLDPSEVRMAACGSMHKVLSCRASLIDFIVGSSAEGEELDEVTNMLWGYERFYEKILDLPHDDWNDLSGERKESKKEKPAVYRTSSDSSDSGYASQSPSTIKTWKGKKVSTSLGSDNESTLVRSFWVFHATKV